MKIGMKIGGGYTLILAIMAGVGGLAIYCMISIKVKSNILANEYAEAMTVEVEIDKFSREASACILDFTLSENIMSYQKGEEVLEKLLELIKDAQVLADRSPHLVKLRANISEIKSKIEDYVNTVKQLKVLNEERNAARVRMNEAAKSLDDIFTYFRDLQNTKFKKEIAEKLSDAKLLERVHKLNLYFDLSEQMSNVRMAIVKFQTNAEDRQSGMSKMDEYFKRIDAHFSELKTIHTKPEDLAKLAEARTLCDDYMKAGNDVKTPLRKTIL